MSALPASLQRQDLNQQLIDIAHRAGEAILQVYHQQGDIATQQKSDDSPVTQADIAAHKVICQALGELTPDIPVLSEESDLPSFTERRHWDYYWLIDPLDGTKEFINRHDEFTVNIALIHQQRPRLGLVHSPVLGSTYLGDLLSNTCGAQKLQSTEQGLVESVIKTRAQALGEPLTIVGSRRHGAEAINTLITQLDKHFSHCQLTSMGSSLKLCLIAEGKAQLYPRLAPTCEWDTAAAQAVVEAAGGQVLGPDFTPLRYNHKESLLNPDFFVIGDPALDWAGLLRP